MDNQQEIRDQLNDLITTKGLKANFIAKKLEIDPSLLCRFRHNKRDLWDETLETVAQYLKNYQ